MVQQLSSLRVAPDLDASKYAAGAKEKVAADKAMVASSNAAGQAVAATDTKISQAGDVLARLSRQYVDGYASAQRFNSALNTLSRGVDQGKIKMVEAGAILDGIYKKYGLMADASQFAAKGQMELAAAVTNANARMEQQRRIVPSNTNIPAANANSSFGRQNNFAALNATNQFQDIAITAAMGQSIPTIALQQGTQLGMALQMSMGEQGATGVVKMLGSAVAGLFSPINLAAIGLTAAAAAAIQFGSAILGRGKSIEDILKSHKTLIDEIAKAYPEAAAAAKVYEDQVGKLPQTVLSANAAEQIKEEKDKVASILSDLSARLRVTGGDYGMFGQAGSEAFAKLGEQIQAGEIDAVGLQHRLGEIRLDPSLPDYARDFALSLQDSANQAAELERRLQGSGAAAKFLSGGFNGPGGLPIYLDPNAGASSRNRALSDEQTQLARMRRSYDADIGAIGARSPAERAAAARSAAAANVNEGETPQARQLRINLAGQRAQIEAQHQLDEAQKQRKLSLDATLASQQLELDLIGKTTGEAAQMRFEFERIQQLREDAARNHTIVDPKEVEAIKEAAKAAGELADATARAKLGNDLQFERSQLFRTPQEQAIASRLRGTGIGMNSPEAQMMRDNQNFAEVKGIVTGFLGDFESELVDSGGDIGKALGHAVLNGVNSILDKIISNLFDQLANSIASAVTGVTNGGGSGSGIFGSLLGSIFGTSKGGSAGSFGTVDGFAKMLGIGANDNYATGAITRAPLAAIGSDYSVANATNFIRQYASAIGIDPSTALTVAKSEGLGAGIWQSNFFRDGFREPSFGPFQLLKGGSGTGFGTGLGNAFQAQTGLDPANPANWQQSTAFALDQAKTNGWGAWYGAKNAGITGFDGIDKSATSAAGALDKFTTGSNQAVAGLGNVGQAGNEATRGLSSFANNLSQFQPGGIGGAPTGWNGVLGSLFGGSTGWGAAGDWLAENPGDYIGLWDSGGYTGPGPKHKAAGIVHAGEIVWSQDDIARHGGVNAVESLRVGDGRGYVTGGIVGSFAFPVANQNSRSAPVVNINPVVNNQSSKVTADVETRRNANGSIDIVTTIKDVVADSAVTRGSQVNNALRQGFGAQQTLRRLG